MIEVWRDIPGFEGCYQISNLGRLKSFKVYPNGYILSVTNSDGGYLRFVLSAKGRKSKSVKIHRLVAETFIPNPQKLPEVNHIDGNKQNNVIDNLEWCTHQHNIIHSMTVLHPHQNDGLVYYNRFVKTKRIVQMDLESNLIAVYANAADAEKATGVCARNILQVANRTPFNEKGLVRKTAGHFKWAFESEVVNGGI